jgi:cell division protein FtsQ
MVLYIDYEGSHYQIILQLEFHLFREDNKKNSEFAQLCRVIYDDDFLKKNIIAIQIMPNGNLKCSIELQLSN